ncbi:hypothetical protein PVK06_030752 [Gossypium arboreum]|uniref:Transposase MuDR plant domain-containing protein n=1 Tax=Gossypium arboreum TaxID=29729 RepID=A0ABR0NQ64_GOSAR|nr:hypothetical protein PVK06_030752 [Gossypium arboreum]
MFLLTVGEGDVKRVEVDEEGDDEGVESDGEESSGQISLGSTVGEDNDSEVAANEYVGDFATSDGMDIVATRYVSDFATSYGVDNVTIASSGEEEDGNEIKVWDSDEYGSLVGFDKDEEHEDGERMRNKFPLYSDKLKFSLGMLFKDGKQFKSAIQKYSKKCRKQLKFIKNELKSVVVRCIASPNCP